MTGIVRAVILCLAFVSLATAGATAGEIQQGTVEFLSDATFQYSSYSFGGTSDSVTRFDINAGAGYFATSMVEVAGQLRLNHVSVSDESETAVGLTGSVLLNFATSENAIPYVGARLGFLAHSGDTSLDATEAILPELVLGVRLPARDVISLNVFAGYRHLENALGLEELSANEAFFGFGVTVFLTGGVS